MIARVADDLRANIDRLYPEGEAGAATDAGELHLPLEFERGDAEPIASDKSGFIQAIAIENLLELARKHSVVLRLLRRPGEFVAEGAVLAEAVPRASASSDLKQAVLAHVYFGHDRTPTQDIEYSIDQLVEVAVRALSPVINDPFTAITCIEWLGASLIQLAKRKMPLP